MNRRVLLMFGAAAMTGCGAPPIGQFGSAVSVLVDLSQTWHQDRYRERNENLLATVGQAIANVCADIEPPVEIRYHAIGDMSFGRAALCHISYDPKTFNCPDPAEDARPASSSDTSEVCNRDHLRRLLIHHCPMFVLAQPHEPSTLIGGAIVQAADAWAAMSADSSRTIIILSDMLEESDISLDLEGAALENCRILILYRVLEEDRHATEQIERLRTRIADWKRRLERHGATVLEMDDVAIIGSAQALTTLLLQPQWR